MEITVIGYWGGFPARNEATSGYLFEAEGFKLLVDCGSSVISQIQNYCNPEDLNAVILSHYHNDHISDVGTLQYARLIKGFIGTKPPTLLIYGHREDQQGFERLTYEGVTKGVEYNPELPLEVGPFTITFLKTKHPADCYAMRISNRDTTVVYTADTSYFNELVSFSRNADLVITECNLYQGMDGEGAGHMTSSDAGKLASQAEVGELLLTHLPHFGNHLDLKNQAQEHFNGKIELAKTGWNWKKE
ncbi:MBL fold metallo-hydrolase [Bacillus sp. AK128]